VGVSCAEAKMVGLTVEQIRGAGYSCAEAKAVGFTVQERRQAGYSAEGICEAEGLKELKQGGMAFAEFKAQGWTSGEARAAGYTCKEAKEAGYTCKEAKEAGYGCHEAQQAGWLSYEGQQAGYHCCAMGQVRRRPPLRCRAPSPASPALTPRHPATPHACAGCPRRGGTLSTTTASVDHRCGRARGAAPHAHDARAAARRTLSTHHTHV